ncbi:MAG TPA: hypothetical protein VJ866_03705 [Pyrinomonadaceae bacterium]|nr:hypothetical protein [Pyrinomonadaceae bacterium]
MDAFNPTDEVIQLAFALALFILGDEAEAFAVVREALSKMEVAAAAQVKRLYYSPTRRTLWQRARPAGNRTKVTLSDTHLLQRLVYVESEPYERAREQRRDALRAEDLLVHYVKHLIRISIRRNSFYVALGVSRLLHSYSTNETMEIYNVVVQDPDRVKDDYYYRSRKGRLLQEVKERFEEFVNLCRGSRGEERFQTLDAPGELAGLVAECLEQFSPWRTPCPIPARYDPTTDEIPTLSSAHQGEEDKVEINRIHAVVHPECYELLTGSLKLEPPASRLSVPRFNLPNGKNNMSSPNDKQRRHGPPLGGSEVAALKHLLAEQSARRKATHARLLSVAVNGAERARLDLWRAGSVSVAVGDRDELVEVRAQGEDGWTLLAAHLLGGERANASEVVLEGGQRLTFSLTHGPGEAAPASLTVAYQETLWPRAASLFGRRLLRGLAAPEGRAFTRPAFALLLLLVCAGALALYVFRNVQEPETARLQPSANQPVSQPANDAPAHNDAPDHNSPDAGVTSESRGVRQAETHDAARRDAVRRPPSKRPLRATAPAEQARANLNNESAESESGAGGADSPGDADATRSVKSAASAMALARVRKVFIEVTAVGELGARTTRLLAGSLRAGGRLTPTDAREEADAAFKIKVSGGSAGRRPVTASVRLVNEDGEVIWPAAGRGRAGVYTGTVEDVTRRIAEDLLKDVLKSDARQ